MLYFINDVEVSEKDFKSELEDAITEYVNDTYDDLLDESYPTYEIGYLKFSASQILRECDPIAYRCGISDEVSYKLSEEIDNFDDGDYEDTYSGKTFRTESEPEDE